MANETDINEADDTASPEGIGVELARATLGDLVLRAGYGNEQIILTRKGKPTAAIIGMKDLERLRTLLGEAAA